MEYALFTVIAPRSAGRNAVTFLDEFSESTEKAKTYLAGCKELVPGAWECDLTYGARGLSVLVSLAQSNHLESRILFFDVSPSWVVTSVTEKDEP